MLLSNKIPGQLQPSHCQHRAHSSGRVPGEILRLRRWTATDRSPTIVEMKSHTSGAASSVSLSSHKRHTIPYNMISLTFNLEIHTHLTLLLSICSGSNRRSISTSHVFPIRRYSTSFCTYPSTSICPIYGAPQSPSTAASTMLHHTVRPSFVS